MRQPALTYWPQVEPLDPCPVSELVLRNGVNSLYGEDWPSMWIAVPPTVRSCLQVSFTYPAAMSRPTMWIAVPPAVQTFDRAFKCPCGDELAIDVDCSAANCPDICSCSLRPERGGHQHLRSLSRRPQHGQVRPAALPPRHYAGRVRCLQSRWRLTCRHFPAEQDW